MFVLSPAQKLAAEMQNELQLLADGNSEIKLERARAEVDFRKAQKDARWDNQPLSVYDWNINAAPDGLPSYWIAGAQFAAARVLSYAKAAVKAGREPAQVEKIVEHCISLFADRAYTEKVHRYAKLTRAQLNWAKFHFNRAVRLLLEKPLDDLGLEAWERRVNELEAKGTRDTESAAAEEPLDADRTQDAEQRLVGAPSSPPPALDTTASRWEDVAILLVSDEAVEITIGSNTSIKNFHELRFVDRRKDRPNQAWTMLRILAWHKGIITDAGNAGQQWSKVEKRIQEIRKALRQLTSIPTDPLPYISGTGYRAQFRISCAPAYYTDKQPNHPSFDLQVRETYRSEAGRHPARSASKPSPK
jgi:hypothetical protein